MTPKAAIMKYSSRCDHCRRENWVCFDCAVSAIRAAVQEETTTLREALEEIKPILNAAHFTHCLDIVEKALGTAEGGVRFLACGEEYTEAPQ